MKQRYHYNVANTRVEQHVEKGNVDGLYISSVACCHELWGLIMDAGTGFQLQVSRPLLQFSDELSTPVCMLQQQLVQLQSNQISNQKVQSGCLSLLSCLASAVGVFKPNGSGKV